MQTVKKIVDLSHPLVETTVVYPGDPKPHFTVATTIDNEGYNLFNVHIGTQSGSHVDAPYHFNYNGKTIDQLPLSYFVGNALVIDVSYKKDREQITLEEVSAYESELKNKDIVLFRTDWYQYEGSPRFFEHPYLSEQAGKYLLEKGIKILGIDAINLDATGGTEFPIHSMYAAANGLIAENLAHFDEIDFKDPFVIFLPLKFMGLDGSPVRAVAMQFEGM